MALRDRLIEETTAFTGTVHWAGLRPNINGKSTHRKVVVASRVIRHLNRQNGLQEPVAPWSSITTPTIFTVSSRAPHRARTTIWS